MKKKGSEKKRHVVAWLNKAEWDQVRDYLYSMDSSLQRFALERISAWRARCANSFPVAVDCTADLVRCQVRDRSGQPPKLILLFKNSQRNFHQFFSSNHTFTLSHTAASPSQLLYFILPLL
uniref:Uncharacterized protein n=1 Tax=Neolamprologus brichardi TaxID=32507 RepID=A0A3Q4G8E0_NEOBR